MIGRIYNEFSDITRITLAKGSNRTHKHAVLFSFKKYEPFELFTNFFNRLLKWRKRKIVINEGFTFIGDLLQI